MVIVLVAASWLAVLALLVALRLNATRSAPKPLPGKRTSTTPLPLQPREAHPTPLAAEAQSPLAGPAGRAVGGF
jgi:hypothetical protein